MLFIAWNFFLFLIHQNGIKIRYFFGLLLNNFNPVEILFCLNKKLMKFCAVIQRTVTRTIIKWSIIMGHFVSLTASGV